GRAAGVVTGPVQQRLQPGPAAGPRQQEALAEVAAEGRQAAPLLRRLDTFGHRHEPERRAQPQDRPGQGRLLRVVGDPGGEGPVDLQHVEEQAAAVETGREEVGGPGGDADGDVELPGAVSHPVPVGTFGGVVRPGRNWSGVGTPWCPSWGADPTVDPWPARGTTWTFGPRWPRGRSPPFSRPSSSWAPMTGRWSRPWPASPRPARRSSPATTRAAPPFPATPSSAGAVRSTGAATWS